MGRDLYPKLNIWDVAKPELEGIYRERYGLSRTAEKIGRQLPSLLARSPEVPHLLYEALKLASSGKLRARIDSDDLQTLGLQVGQHNRRLPGAILAAGFIIAAAVLASYQVPPLAMTYSVPALGSLGVGLVIAWRSLRSPSG